MTRASFRLKPELKEAICDRAKVENKTQTDLIREAVKEYLLQPCRLRRAEANKNISINRQAKKSA